MKIRKRGCERENEKILFSDEISGIAIQQAVQLVSSHCNIFHVRISVAVIETDACVVAVPPVPSEIKA